MTKKRPLPADRLAECKAAHDLFLAKKTELGLSQKKIAELADMTPAAVNLYFKGINPLNAKFAAVLANALRVPVSAFSQRLADEIGGMVQHIEHIRPVGISPTPPENMIYMTREEHAATNVEGHRIEVRTRSVPVVGKAMLGVDGYFEELDYPVGHGEGVLNVTSRDNNAYGLRVVGHSMAPRIKHNEFVLIEPNHAYNSGDEVLVKTVKGQSMIKSFAYLRDGEYKFDSINAEYAPVILDASEVESIQYVGAIVKGSMFEMAE